MAMADQLRVLLSDSLAPQGVEGLTRHPRLSVETKTGLTPAQLADAIGPYHAIVIRTATKRDRAT